MTRAHVEFIQSQALPWRKGLHGGARDDVESRVLSIDPGSGACSVLLRYPAGWRRGASEFLAADEEFFVIDGELSINGVTYPPYAYAYLPAGHERREAVSAGGAVVLAFFEVEPRLVRPDETFREDAGLVEFIDTHMLEWKLATHDPEVPPGLMTKTLRIDPDTKDRTWMNSIAPLARPEGFMGSTEWHPVVEEMYQLSGDLAGDRGVMKAGAYFWRPPDVRHGSYGTRTGYLSLWRCKGGPLVNFWSEETYPLSYAPPHDPVLPPEMEEFGRKPWDGLTPY